MSYIISEERLKELLYNELTLHELEYAGVDNWSGCGEGREEFLLDCINGRIPEEEIPEEITRSLIVELDLQDYEKF